ncbi:MAG: hypothetical protein IPL26_06565 [Leptospiraceae bacterium]|nr:hypothetical protein [Leptospiraceae bacterium]
MTERVTCVHSDCGKEFEYEPEIIDGATKNVGANADDMGSSKGIFSKPKTKKMNTLLECPHCKQEDYYKVTVTV